MWQEEGAFCVESLVVFPLPPPSTFHCLSVLWVAIFSGVWALMAELSGFANHWCSLHLGAGLNTNSASSRMPQAPNLDLARQLLIIIIVIIIIVDIMLYSGRYYVYQHYTKGASHGQRPRVLWVIPSLSSFQHLP